MAKWKVEVGGFVTVFRQRNITVFADTEEEAREKAVDKFIDIQQSGSGCPICQEGTVDSIERIN